jgi:hypothetical protein
MFIGAYLCVSGFIFVLSLLVLFALFPNSSTVPGLRKQVFTFAVLSFAVIGVSLTAFISLSALVGLMNFREAGSWSYPNDYLAYGPIGWIIMILLPLGILSPIVILIWLRLAPGFVKRPEPGEKRS